MGATTKKPKRERRTREQIETLKDRLYGILAEQHPATVRGVFYLAETQGFVPKTDAGYDVVGRYLLQMRIAGQVPFDWVSDNTRWMRKPRSYSSLEEALQATARTYRRSLWADQDVSVEVWAEKDAIAGVLYEETSRWDVPLMVSRGFSSVTFLHEAARAIQASGKPCYLYYYGDHDPSGVAVDKAIERRLREFAPDAEIHFERVAVLRHQIDEWSLPTRPTKDTDRRCKTFVGDSVELDAIPAVRLRQLVRECITRHVDRMALEVTRAAERSERDVLTSMERHLRGQVVLRPPEDAE